MPKPKKTEQADVQPLAVDTITAAKMLDLAPGTLENWRYARKPKGPRWARIEGKIVYPIVELEAYLAANTVQAGGSRKGVDA